MITGFDIGLFLTPNKIVGGGVSGLSTVLFHALSVPVGVSFLVIDLIFLMIWFKILGESFTFKTLLGAALISMFTQAFSFIPFYTENIMLATIFGGVLYGFGFTAGASTGGTDILGCLIQYKFQTVLIGKLLLFVDGIIILVSLIIFKKLELTLFGIISLFISSTTIDFVIGQLNISCLAFVITEHGEEISSQLISTSPRGVTMIDVVGAYTKDEKKMLFCALKESESEEFQRKILLIDPKAFIVFSESQRIKGNGFYLYK